MAIKKTANADCITSKVDRNAWLNATSKRKDGRIKTASEVLSQYDPSRWLLSHVTIMASVDIQLAKPNDPKSDYFIKPEHSIFVNNNGDCWERELLAKTYRTFLGANNYVEHIQQPEFARGKVVDVALREVDLGLDAQGKPNNTLYVDLLIATSWEFPDMCQKILSGEYNAVSMGCLIAYSRCSRCGNVAHDDSEQCEHVQLYRRNTFYDEYGNKRIIAEICGHKDDPKSVNFMDASWVRKPAFPGAVLRNIVSPQESIAANITKAAIKGSNDPLMESVQSRAILQSEHHSVDAFMKAASLKVAEDPASEEDTKAEPEGAARFGDPAKESAFPEMPADPSAEGGDPSASGAAPDASADPTAEQPDAPKTSPEEADSTPFSDIQQNIEDSVVTQVKQNLLDKVQKALATKTDSEVIGDGINRYIDATRQGEAFVKEASSKTVSKYLQDRYSIDITKVPNVKLASSLMAFASVGDVNLLRKYGFTRKDMVEVLAFVSSRMTGKKVGDDVAEYIAKTAGNPSVDYNLGFVINAARPLTPFEKEAMDRWPRLLNKWNT